MRYHYISYDVTAIVVSTGGTCTMNIYSELVCLPVRLYIVGVRQLTHVPDLELNIESRKVVFMVRFQKFQQI
jgi:hypothetical protein